MPKVRSLASLALALLLSSTAQADKVRQIRWAAVDGAVSYVVYGCSEVAKCWTYPDFRNWFVIKEVAEPHASVTVSKTLMVAVAARYANGSVMRESDFGWWMRP